MDNLVGNTNQPISRWDTCVNFLDPRGWAKPTLIATGVGLAGLTLLTAWLVYSRRSTPKPVSLATGATPPLTISGEPIAVRLATGGVASDIAVEQPLPDAVQAFLNNSDDRALMLSYLRDEDAAQLLNCWLDIHEAAGPESLRWSADEWTHWLDARDWTDSKPLYDNWRFLQEHRAQWVEYYQMHTIECGWEYTMEGWHGIAWRHQHTASRSRQILLALHDPDTLNQAAAVLQGTNPLPPWRTPF